MSDLFKVPMTRYWLYDCWIDPAGNPCPRGNEGVQDHRRSFTREWVANKLLTRYVDCR